MKIKHTLGLLGSLLDLCSAAGPYRRGHRSTPVDAEVLEAALINAFAAIAWAGSREVKEKATRKLRRAGGAS